MSAKECIRKIDEARARGNKVAARWYIKLYKRAKEELTDE